MAELSQAVSELPSRRGFLIAVAGGRRSVRGLGESKASNAFVLPDLGVSVLASILSWAKEGRRAIRASSVRGERGDEKGSS